MLYQVLETEEFQWETCCIRLYSFQTLEPSKQLGFERPAGAGGFSTKRCILWNTNQDSMRQTSRVAPKSQNGSKWFKTTQMLVIPKSWPSLTYSPCLVFLGTFPRRWKWKQRMRAAALALEACLRKSWLRALLRCQVRDGIGELFLFRDEDTWVILINYDQMVSWTPDKYRAFVPFVSSINSIFRIAS